MFIHLKRDQIPYSDVQLREFFRHMKPKWSSWASAREGQGELCEAVKATLNVLKAVPEHSKPFLRPVNKRDALGPYVINWLMALGTMDRKLQNFQYAFKGEIADDFELIWAHCLRYSSKSREEALGMRSKASRLKICIAKQNQVKK